MVTLEKIYAGETARLEFKREPPTESKKWVKTVVAFANGRGGTIVFGVDDKTRRVVGVDPDRAPVLADAVAESVASTAMHVRPSSLPPRSVLALSSRSSSRVCKSASAAGSSAARKSIAVPVQAVSRPRGSTPALWTTRRSSTKRATSRMRARASARPSAAWLASLTNSPRRAAPPPRSLTQSAKRSTIPACVSTGEAALRALSSSAIKDRPKIGALFSSFLAALPESDSPDYENFPQRSRIDKPPQGLA